ncbi:hypothetical protein Pyn_16019 [Prunus yedoensis var. nudiflora]|uniref:Uncharacterized protein n=1 Tax=Prunus yedoensis var. nudiflora TaxID=2094558 RepID=A0A314YUY7_PRUYE|nr:hypothetical protein Pyn_16019 [Prunus yedoensis var. nudiflora]
MSFAGTPSLLLNVRTTSHNHSLSQSLKLCGRVNGGSEVADADRWLPMDLAELLSRIIVLEQLNSKPPLLLGSSYFKGAQEEMMEAEKEQRRWRGRERWETMEAER